jgi:hypothetical protein
MDLGITHMPLEKALSPNGFNDIFVQNVGPSYVMSLSASSESRSNECNTS